MSKPLTVTDHSRDNAGLNYVYPVLSRRAGGISIGINLNPNNACNWRCIYCQVPNLTRGKAPLINLDILTSELCNLIDDILVGRFYDRYNVPRELQQIKDIALSGNGEPTSSQQFLEVIQLIQNILVNREQLIDTKVVLITNGSYIQRPTVQEGLRRLAAISGEIWFKLDRATQIGQLQVNSIHSSPFRQRVNLVTASQLCPTWIQTCVFALDHHPPDDQECNSYLNLLADLKREQLSLKGVLLYGLARPSLQPEATRLQPLPSLWLEDFAVKIKTLGIEAKVFV